MSMVTSFPQKLETLKRRTFHLGILKEITSTTIPPQYALKELESYELPVVGTYIHSHILPGFRYRVRLTGTNEYLFGGKALKIESIGQGYGKRITFESADILENNNFFWSDSHEAGFAFSPELLSAGEVFQVIDCQGKSVGTFSVGAVNGQEQIIACSHENDTVSINAKVTLRGNMRLLSCDKDIPLAGEAMVRASRCSSSLKFLKTEDNGKTLDNVQHFVKSFE